MQVLCKRQLVRPFLLRTIKTQDKKEEGKKVHSDTVAIGRRPRVEWVWPHPGLLCPVQVIFLVGFSSCPPRVFSFCCPRAARVVRIEMTLFWSSEAILTFSCLPARKMHLKFCYPRCLNAGTSCRHIRVKTKNQKKKKREWDGNNQIERHKRTVAVFV